MLIYLDSCIVIYIVQAMEPWRSRVMAMLRDHPSVQLVISDLVRMECLVGPYKDRDIATEEAFIGYFALCQNVPIRSSTFDLAAHIRADHGLKTPDAIHLAAAIESGCGELWTNDDRFTRAGANIVIRQIV